MDGISSADWAGAVIVSTEVTEFAPSVRDDEDRAQVAIGIDPSTAQESCTALLKDPF